MWMRKLGAMSRSIWAWRNEEIEVMCKRKRASRNLIKWETTDRKNERRENIMMRLLMFVGNKRETTCLSYAIWSIWHMIRQPTQNFFHIPTRAQIKLFDDFKFSAFFYFSSLFSSFISMWTTHFYFIFLFLKTNRYLNSLLHCHPSHLSRAGSFNNW